jgi:DNA-binding response OmpR family regulator
MRVLIVDDDPSLRSVIARGLAKSGMECTAASSAEEAERALAEGPGYDVMLLDVVMPGRSGFELLESLRARGDDTSIIFLTGQQAVGERIRGLRLGADDYVVKPFELSELEARIEAVVRRRQMIPVLEIGSIRIDLGRRIVEHEGKRLETSPREFDVLRALVEAHGKVVTRSALLHSIWGIDFDPGTNLVDVVIGRLRKKLGSDGPRCIETIVGEGYRFNAAQAATS